MDTRIYPFQFGEACETRILKAMRIYIERFQDKIHEEMCPLGTERRTVVLFGSVLIV